MEKPRYKKSPQAISRDAAERSRQEILNIAQEEAAEIIVAISKVRRFGLYSVDPRIIDGVTNKEHLEEEFGDLLAMMRLAIEAGMVDTDAIAEAGERKITKLRNWSKIDREILDAAMAAPVEFRRESAI